MTDAKKPERPADGRRKAAAAKVIGVDGFEWTADQEREFNELFAGVFSGAAGDKALQYLRNITINRRPPADVSDAELRHLEGQRYLASVIEQRVKNGRDRR